MYQTEKHQSHMDKETTSTKSRKKLNVIVINSGIRKRALTSKIIL